MRGNGNCLKASSKHFVLAKIFKDAASVVSAQIIGVSLSEPHTSRVDGDLSRYIYIIYVCVWLADDTTDTVNVLYALND